jgi:hypothetical protein
MAFRTFSLLAVAALLYLAACDNSPSPLMSQPMRAGADKSVPVSPALPPAAEQRYEPGIVSDNEEKETKVGAMVAGSGGQQAQKEKDRKARDAVEAEQARQRDELGHQQNVDAKVSTQ